MQKRNMVDLSGTDQTTAVGYMSISKSYNQAQPLKIEDLGACLLSDIPNHYKTLDLYKLQYRTNIGMRVYNSFDHVAGFYTIDKKTNKICLSETGKEAIQTNPSGICLIKNHLFLTTVTLLLLPHVAITSIERLSLDM